MLVMMAIMPMAFGQDESRSEHTPDLPAEVLIARAKSVLATTNGELRLHGLQQPVEVLRDKWGIPHIYAQNARDLFFAQGFVQAQDRLWQMDLWRRTTLGTLAEIVGPDAIERDRFARLIEYRGDLESEWDSYGPDTKAIVESFVAGVNAFVAQCRDELPIEFQLTGTLPEPWTPRVCIGRMAGFIMCRNAASELLRAQLVRDGGASQAAQLLPLDPLHDITVPPGIDLEGIDQRVTALITSASAAVRLPLSPTGSAPLGSRPVPPALPYHSESSETYGSNNWVIAGRLTETGKPILANDPHRPITLPSLRYIVHLNCPPAIGSSSSGDDRTGAARLDRGWNVIGGTEPALPGVAIGHNQRVAWGLTIVGTDQTDVFVEETHADDPHRYRVENGWQEMRIENQQIRVRGEAEPRKVDLKFTRHGPVIFEDRQRRRAYVLRWVGSEPGTAGYLGALAINRVENWSEFLNAAARWKVPSENLIYADVDGHIGWIAAALTPVRSGWDGLMPVPGTHHDWSGFLPTGDLPQEFDPARGYIATANHNILPSSYSRVLSYEWAAPFRFQRIDEVLRRQIETGKRFSIGDSMKLQHDSASVAARQLVAHLQQAKLGDGAELLTGTNAELVNAEQFERCVELLEAWDCVLTSESAAAALYMVWQARLIDHLLKPRVPEKLWAAYSARAPVLAAIGFLDRQRNDPNSSPSLEHRRHVLAKSLHEAIVDLSKRQGADPDAWQLGKLHQAQFRHMLASPMNRQAVTGTLGPAEASAGPQGIASATPADDRALIAAAFNLSSVPRSGDAQAPIATGGPNFHQTTGASYRHIIDLSDWDRSVATSVPGQSGQPGSRHYGDLLPLWANGEYFPLKYSRTAVEQVTAQRLVLVPAN
jgi:penicillin amidase